ncbi:hypothetical protein [Microvirga aerophila]|uniref:Uncharacterized protein n=1 Tax=Microvirga aerophila TaxID=670291 RepID=A0A512BQY6_9HYPH|nr:hypothetical protein [Microvirga aerophila]GEO14433.1 hypothetical protein MAE02_21290 [Microvirga aerophila]
MPTTLDTLWAMWSSTMAALGTVVAVGGGAAAVAFLFFRFLGEKWINAKFEERLAAYKHVQQQELERLKLKINTLMDRTTKLHQREFDVIPETWAKLNYANAAIQSFTSAFQQYPDIKRMSDAHLEEFLANSPLAGWQKAELHESYDKHEYYRKAIYWHHAARAREAFRDFNVYLMQNGIFIPDPLKSKFTEFSDILWNALIEHEGNEELEIRPRERGKQKALNGKGQELLKAIEKDVQDRLWSIHATDV